MKAKPVSLSTAEAALEELTLARALEECLQAMEQGETDLDGLARRYPNAEKEIRPLLDIAQQLRRRRTSGLPLPLEFREELRGRLMSHRAGS